MVPSRDIVVLATGQALTGTATSLLTSVSSLSGSYLAPVPSLSTLPVTATVLGTLLMIYPAAELMGRLGRRGGFILKAVIGIIGGAVCCIGLMIANFALIVGTFLLGNSSLSASTTASPPSMPQEPRSNAPPRLLS
jgi:MFS family permease